MSEHYFTASPAVEAEERTHRFSIRGVERTVVTASGVFSADRLDKGTQVLLDHVPDPAQTGTFLDLGCGGVLATDVNERSLALTARNAAAAGLDNVRTAPADALLAELRESSTPVDLIWSNPPVRIGKEALHALLLDWLALLSDDGEAWLVVLKNLGADSLAVWLKDQGWDVNRMASSKGFRVLRVRRRHG